MTALPLFGVALELVAEVPSTALAGRGVLVGTLVGVGTGDAGTTGAGVAVTLPVVVVPLWVVDFVVVWLVEVACAVRVEVVVREVVAEVLVDVGVAAETTCTGVDPESSAPAGP
jgi:hypothetical protein